MTKKIDEKDLEKVAGGNVPVDDGQEQPRDYINRPPAGRKPDGMADSGK